MTEKKRRIIVTDFEHRLLVKALAEFRNQLLEVKKPTEDINDLTGAAARLQFLQRRF